MLNTWRMSMNGGGVMISAPIHGAIRSRPDATRVAHRLSPMWGRQTLSDRGMWQGGICCTMGIQAVCWVGDPKPEERSACCRSARFCCPQADYYRCSPSFSTNSVADRLKEIEDLHDRKLMTDAEYQDKRAKIIAEL